MAKRKQSKLSKRAKLRRGNSAKRGKPRKVAKSAAARRAKPKRAAVKRAARKGLLPVGPAVAAEMDEPDVWGVLTERDSVIFHDNDFEIFIDPDGDTHAYYELEVNALGTPWDLMLITPYRDGGPAIHAWDIAGLQVGVRVRGTPPRMCTRSSK